MMWVYITYEVPGKKQLNPSSRHYFFAMNAFEKLTDGLNNMNHCPLEYVAMVLNV